MERITLRLPDEVHAAIAEIAKGEDRSLNAQIVRILKDYINERKNKSKELDNTTGEL